ncbi:MAG: insulinase family protein [Bacteroidales bacterium]|nr:insulinase family protein [Bacteroidales bacterium]
MKKILLLFSLLIFSLLLTNAQGKRFEFTEYDLDNGMHVILYEDHATPVVAVDIVYHVGSKNEEPDRTGFAHFFEHLMFEGSDNIERGTYFQYVQNAGGDNNAFTSFDLTTYYEVLPSNQLELGLWLESERLLHLKVDSIGVETQRKVVKEERKARYENQPYGSFMEAMFSRAFTKHPYHWIPIGEVQYIDQATLSEFMEFYKKFYVPENATLAIAGDIDVEKTKKLVDAYFGEIPKSGKEIYRPNITEPKQTKEIRDTVFDNIQLPAVFWGFKMPAQGTDDYYALDMLQTLLSGGESSRLYKELVDNKQLAVQVAAFPYGLEDAGLFIAFALGNVGADLAEIEKIMQAEVDKVISEGIPEKEFQKLKNTKKNDFISSNSKMEGIALSLANYYTYYGNTDLINTGFEKYDKVTADDIIRVAKQYLTPQNRVALYYLPKSEQN